MKSRLRYLAGLLLAFLFVFVIQKPLFMLYNGSLRHGYAAVDYFQVIAHGLAVDFSMIGYLLIFPWLLCFACIWRTFPCKIPLSIYHGFVAALISAAFVVDTSLFEFWDFKLDATIFTYLDSPKNALASVSPAFFALRFLCFAVLSVLLLLLLNKLIPKMVRPPKPFACSAAMLLIGGLIGGMCRGGIKESTANIGKVYYCDDMFLNKSAVNPCFSLLHSLSKTKKLAEEFHFFSEEERATKIEGIFDPTSANTTSMLNCRRPNILVIILEGFGSSMTGNQATTPHFNRLSQEGIFFSNCYAGSFRTDRGLVCIFSGYPGLPTTSIMKSPPMVNTMPSFVRTLKGLGYSTDFLYGGDINFTNMQGYLRTMGFSKLTSDIDFPVAEQNYSKWGVHDGVTFERLYQDIAHRENHPWLTAFLTLSSHEPFEVPLQQSDNEVYNAFAFTDKCLGQFIDKLKRLPTWENLLVICLPDHGFHYPKNNPRAYPEYFRIPMLWLGGAIKQPATYDKIMSQTDLAATLLGQLGLPHAEFDFSRDVFSTSYKYPNAFYSYNNGLSFIDGSGISIFDNEAGKVIFSSPKDFGQERADKGKAILQTLHQHLTEAMKGKK